MAGYPLAPELVPRHLELVKRHQTLTLDQHEHQLNEADHRLEMSKAALAEQQQKQAQREQYTVENRTRRRYQEQMQRASLFRRRTYIRSCIPICRAYTPGPEWELKRTQARMDMVTLRKAIYSDDFNPDDAPRLEATFYGIQRQLREAEQDRLAALQQEQADQAARLDQVWAGYQKRQARPPDEFTPHGLKVYDQRRQERS